ncbi:Replication-associated recombination protein A [Mannheimia haemolytica]|nr:Replication-associated recombination protein A [Mannheimia haemolytica]
MSSLSFDFSEDFRPLAAKMRPRNLAEYVGQSHLIGEGKTVTQSD